MVVGGVKREACVDMAMALVLKLLLLLLLVMEMADGVVCGRETVYAMEVRIGVR